MPNKMLIDSSHPEETRVVVTHGNRIEEFDFESQDKKQLRGNIYLARVTRVEPSLQAAFVEYGGNRHGFLAFSEIHPDYYQIPVADRQALLKAEAEAAQNDEDDEEEARPERSRASNGRRNKRRGRKGRNGDDAKSAGGENGAGEAGDEEEVLAADAAEEGAEVDANDEDAAIEADEAVEGDDDAGEARGKPSMAADASADVISEERAPTPGDEDGEAGSGNVQEVEHAKSEEHHVESVGAGDALEEARERRRPPRRHYKIQEVIKRRQILLVQVVKEERGNKGAALTTYLSLAGRYSVLMPNTARGGGISRKITNVQDRKRLKDMVKELEVPQGMGIILRTAGESRTKPEIKRDYEYLMRMWENVRNLTLQSTAPALVYEEGSLIKRSIRDLYNKEIDEIQVSGEDGYREAKDFMRLLMPSHAKMVQPYRDPTPIFARAGIEAQLDRMLQPQVTLKSGGYLIINQTEALVSIDVNSGRSTREHSIEDTALQTNLEAAEEVARQLRLRDLAGLIVIDFIDMEEGRNNRAVEKKLKDCLKNDRARIQVGRISHFGLLEMSRQRIRASVLESTMKPCPHCGGAGHVRSDSSVALTVVRAIEEHLLKDNRYHITVRTTQATALYILNHKRSTLTALEDKFGVAITIETDEAVGAQHYAIVRGAEIENPKIIVQAPPPVEPEEPEIEEIVDEDEEDAVADGAEAASSDDQQDGQRRRKRRRRRRGGKDRDREEQAAGGSDDDAVSDDAEGDDEDEAAEAVAAEVSEDAEGDANGKKRRRGKRGGRKNREAAEQTEGDAIAADAEIAAEAEAPVAEVIVDAEIVEVEEPAEKPKRGRKTAAKAVKPAKDEAKAKPAKDEAKAKPAKDEAKSPAKSRARSKKAAVSDEAEVVAEAVDVDVAPVEVSAPEVVSANEPVTAGEDAAPARRNRRSATASDEPSEPKVSSTTTEGDAAPAKKGWWQRKSFF